MNNKISIFIEQELYPLIISPIEIYIKPQMTVQERVAAKQQVFPRIRELIRGAELYTNLSIDEIIQRIKDIMEKQENVHNGAILQNKLVEEMLNEIQKQAKKEKTI